MIRRKINRRRFLAHLCWSFLGLIGLTSVYRLFRERLNVKTTYVDINYKNLPASLNGYKILQFSDVHLGHFYNKTDLQKLVQHMNTLESDIIVFTGDMVDNDPSELVNSVDVLSQLHAPYGKWAVLGNHDHWESAEFVERCLTNAGFTVLRNSHDVITVKGNKLYLAGVDSYCEKLDDIELATSDMPPESFVILLAHEPDFAEISKKYPIDLQLSGHSHGGQIRLPNLPPLHTPPLGEIYVEGSYEFEHMVLYVNKGIGTTGIPIRMYCQPEVTLIALKSV